MLLGPLILASLRDWSKIASLKSIMGSQDLKVPFGNLLLMYGEKDNIVHQGDGCFLYNALLQMGGNSQLQQKLYSPPLEKNTFFARILRNTSHPDVQHRSQNANIRYQHLDAAFLLSKAHYPEDFIHKDSIPFVRPFLSEQKIEKDLEEKLPPEEERVRQLENKRIFRDVSEVEEEQNTDFVAWSRHYHPLPDYWLMDRVGMGELEQEKPYWGPREIATAWISKSTQLDKARLGLSKEESTGSSESEKDLNSTEGKGKEKLNTFYAYTLVKIAPLLFKNGN